MRTGESKVLILRAILRRSSLRSTGYKRRSYIHERRLRIDCAFLWNDCASGKLEVALLSLFVLFMLDLT